MIVVPAFASCCCFLVNQTRRPLHIYAVVVGFRNRFITDTPHQGFCFHPPPPITATKTTTCWLLTVGFYTFDYIILRLSLQVIKLLHFSQHNTTLHSLLSPFTLHTLILYHVWTCVQWYVQGVLSDDSDILYVWVSVCCMCACKAYTLSLKSKFTCVSTVNQSVNLSVAPHHDMTSHDVTRL